MGNESGKSIVTLVIMTILIIIGAIVIVNYAKKMMGETKEQDLRTNMLLIQAETKKCVEEVCFRIVNLDETKEEDITKINEIKSEYLKGILINDAPQEVQDAIKQVPEIEFNENCYYLNEEMINEMGIKNNTEEQYGYFIVKYDFTNINVEVINTNGYNEKYTLTQINEDISEEL